MWTCLYPNLSEIAIKQINQDTCIKNGYGPLGIPKRHLIKNNHLLIYIHFVKITERLIKTCFNNSKIATTKIHVLLFARFC